MLLDFHVHTKGISHCCRKTANEVYEIADKNGYDGLIITNHYASDYYTEETYDKWIEQYISEWNLCRELGRQYGIKTFCAVEITVDYNPKVHFLIYGIDEKFLRKNQHLGKLSQKQLYELTNKEGCAFIQAHPFRNGTTVQAINHLDGLEINCHPLSGNSYADKLQKIAKENNLSITVGCDYHGDIYRPKGGYDNTRFN